MKSKPWQWPGEWLKDEKFWKDVASRTLSGVLAVGVIYIYGHAVGYFKTPAIVGTTIAVVGMCGMTLIMLILLVIAIRFGRSITGHEKSIRSFNNALIFLGIAAVIGTLLAALGGAFEGMAPLNDFLLFG